MGSMILVQYILPSINHSKRITGLPIVLIRKLLHSTPSSPLHFSSPHPTIAIIQPLPSHKSIEDILSERHHLHPYHNLTQ